METYFEPMQEQMLKKTGKKLHNFGTRARPVGKFVAVIFLILCLLIPLSFIEGQIYSRSSNQDSVTAEIASTAASRQTVIGPVLAVHYRTRIPEKQYFDAELRRIIIKQAVINDHIAYLPARNLATRGAARVERRYRGIYQALLFHLDAKVEGAFEAPADMLKVPDGSEFVDASAAILFSVSDPRGLDSDPDVLVDGKAMRFKATTNKMFEEIMGGSRLEIALGEWKLGQTRSIAFSFPLKLTGTEALSFAPTAENNVVELSSDWLHPSFGGRFLPRKHNIGDKGFNAQWEVSQLARNLDRALQGGSREGTEIMGIRFIDPVNVYLQAERAVKYGSLFIVLTFAAFFIGEFLRRRPMHIMQYALVGLALAIFFLLLIALSEHLPFATAYLAGASACIGLVVIYLAGAFDSWRTALGFGAGLSVLYGMLFGILQMEDRALLMGSLLLFAALAAAMFSTRRLDWYQLKQNEAPTEISGE
ncbi:MAG: cell envelope integrity protein CreD [Azoarcus sp.]|jgi:inner membrane protein|nr:cell envelope integrity protein CreD [Azoarcus sp.]